MATTKKPAVKKTSTPKLAAKMTKAQYDAMNSLFLWNFNYDRDFIEKVWGKGTVLAEHLKAKFSRLYRDYGDRAVGVSFVGELDVTNRAKLFAYILKRHKK
jgi:hypothetical protein